MSASFRNNWWDTHRMDDCLDHGTASPECSSPWASSPAGRQSLEYVGTSE